MFGHQTKAIWYFGANWVHRLFRDVMAGKVASIADTEEIEDMYEHTIEVRVFTVYLTATVNFECFLSFALQCLSHLLKRKLQVWDFAIMRFQTMQKLVMLSVAIISPTGVGWTTLVLGQVHMDD